MLIKYAKYNSTDGIKLGRFDSVEDFLIKVPNCAWYNIISE